MVRLRLFFRASQATPRCALLRHRGGHRQWIVIGALIGALAPAAALCAQVRPTSPTLDASRATACSMRAPIPSLLLRDATTDVPIDSAQVTLRLPGRDGDRPLLTGSRSSATPGQWLFYNMHDTPMPDLSTALELTLVVERAGRPTVRRRVTFGLDERGCHPVLRGERTLRL